MSSESDERLVYIGMSADILHIGHINIISKAKGLISSENADRLIIGLLTNEAIESYKRMPIVNWEERKQVLLALKGVETVVPQHTLDYRINLRKFKPKYCVHGSDWKNPKSAQYQTRQDVMDCLAEWGGELVEPDYTQGVSTTEIIDECASRSSNSLINKEVVVRKEG